MEYYEFKIRISNKEDVEKLFDVVETFTEGSNGSITPENQQSVDLMLNMYEAKE